MSVFLQWCLVEKPRCGGAVPAEGRASPATTAAGQDDALGKSARSLWVNINHPDNPLCGTESHVDYGVYILG